MHILGLYVIIFCVFILTFIKNTFSKNQLAQPIRMLLEHTGTEYKEKQYKCGPAPDFDKSCWFEIKETLGFDFPNLPYMIDGTYIILFINAYWFVELKFD